MSVFVDTSAFLAVLDAVDIEDLENPEVINQIFERYEKEIATT